MTLLKNGLINGVTRRTSNVRCDFAGINRINRVAQMLVMESSQFKIIAISLCVWKGGWASFGASVTLNANFWGWKEVDGSIIMRHLKGGNFQNHRTILFIFRLSHRRMATPTIFAVG